MRKGICLLGEGNIYSTLLTASAKFQSKQATGNIQYPWDEHKFVLAVRIYMLRALGCQMVYIMVLYIIIQAMWSLEN